MRRSMAPKSVSSGWAMSAVKQTTFTPFSVSHLVTVQESSPPEAAKATVWPFRSATVVIAVRSSVRAAEMRVAYGAECQVYSGRLAGRYAPIAHSHGARATSASAARRHACSSAAGPSMSYCRRSAWAVP